MDLAFFVNGLPVASVELKNPNTRQHAEHAVAQYRKRNPNDLFFAKRTLVRNLDKQVSRLRALHQ